MFEQTDLMFTTESVPSNISYKCFKTQNVAMLRPRREFAGPGLNHLWGAHDIIIFNYKLDPSQSPNQTLAKSSRPWPAQATCCSGWAQISWSRSGQGQAKVCLHCQNVGQGQAKAGSVITTLDCMWSYCKGPSISKML